MYNHLLDDVGICITYYIKKKRYFGGDCRRKGVWSIVYLCPLWWISRGTSDVVIFVAAMQAIAVGSHINSLETVVIISQHGPNLCLTKLVFMWWASHINLHGKHFHNIFMTAKNIYFLMSHSCLMPSNNRLKSGSFLD